MTNSQNNKSKKKITKGDIIAIIVASVIISIIIQMNNPGPGWTIIIFVALIWIIKKIVESFFYKGENNYQQNNNERENNIKKGNTKKILVYTGIILGIVIVIALTKNSQNNSNQNIYFEKTNQNSNNSEEIKNLYKNSKYHFNINFPNGWKLESGDGNNIIQRATNGNNIISISIREISTEYKTTFEKFTPTDIRNSLIDGISSNEMYKMKMIDYSEIKDNIVPFFWVKYSITLNNEESIVLEYHFIKDSIIYSIRASSPISEFSKSEEEFKKSISTFGIEAY